MKNRVAYKKMCIHTIEGRSFTICFVLLDRLSISLVKYLRKSTSTAPSKSVCKVTLQPAHRAQLLIALWQAVNVVALLVGEPFVHSFSLNNIFWDFLLFRSFPSQYFLRSFVFRSFLSFIPEEEDKIQKGAILILHNANLGKKWPHPPPVTQF